MSFEAETKIRTTDWSAVAASAPRDRLAALAAAVGYDGVDGEEETLLAQAKEQIQALVTRDPMFCNLIGVTKGRLTVVAYAGGRRPNGTPSNGALWVARCKCGNYQIFRTQALKSPSSKVDRCKACNDLEWLRQGCPREKKAASA